MLGAMGAVGVPEKRPTLDARLPPGAYYALTVLTALNVINLWHRYLMVSSSSALWYIQQSDNDVCMCYRFSSYIHE